MDQFVNQDVAQNFNGNISAIQNGVDEDFRP